MTDLNPSPAPSYACTIWASGDAICIALPGTEGSASHTITIPLAKCEVVNSDWGTPLACQRGFAVLLQVLKDRERAGRSPKIGERGAQPKHLLQGAVESDERYRAWLESMAEGKRASAAEKAEAEAFLEELGL